MANFVERAVVNPNYWLAQMDSQRGHASETLFVARTVKEVSSSLSDFRKDHPLSPPIFSKSVLLAAITTSLVLLTYSYLQTPDDLIRGTDDSQSWRGFTISGNTDNLVIDETWLADNCEKGGEWKGTGIPNSDDKEFAQAFCGLFGNSSQTTP